jgi:putative ABC transport system permease protein
MSSGFRFPTPQTAIWIPLQLDPSLTHSAAFDYRGIARLRPGVSLHTAVTELQRLLPEVPVAFPGRLTVAAIAVTHMTAGVKLLRDVVVGDVGRVLWVVLGGVAALLLIACSNVANLFLARTEGRQREFAVRRALGAGRSASLIDFASEAILLAAAGGALGLGLAALGVWMLQGNGAAASIPRFAEVHVDGFVVAVTVLVSALAAVIVSVLPALRSGRGSASLSATLMATGVSTLGGRARHGVRRALVISQIALALVLVTGAGLFARSFAHLSHVDAGFDAAHASASRLSLPNVTYRSTADAASAAVRTLDALAAVPGVQAAGAVTKLPLDEEARQDSAVFLEDRPLRPNTVPTIHPMEFATPGYFRAMGIPLLAGRVFAAPEPGRDPAKAPREVVVSAAFANRYWPNADAVGRRIRMNPNPDEPWSTIVGVVGSVRDAGLDQPPAEAVYMPLVTTTVAGTLWTPRDHAFIVKTNRDPASLTPAVRSAVQSVAPSLPVYRVISVAALRAQAVARTTFTLPLATRGLAATLFGVSATDPLTMAGAASVLLATAVVASWMPANRAAGVDPATALRNE